ncbi:KTSC domain-containing protein [Pectobacterium versatile]|uniref:KTSC domain-containing protein n=1 Tax=Pectobacterium versatile TaxID=2488639 RepID=UPI00301773A8
MAWREFAPFMSSNLSAVRYDPEQSLLEVEFLNGGRYQYYDVPEQVSLAFEQAESKGVFLAHSIKGHFRYSRV